MRLLRKTLAFGQLPNSKGDLYVPPAGYKGLYTHMTLHNTGASAETVVLNFHDGTDEHEVLNQSIEGYATIYHTFRGAGDVVDDGAKITGNADTASTVTYKLSGTEEFSDVIRSVRGAASNLWTPPTTSHVADDEFDSAVLNPVWAIQNVDDVAVGSISAGTVDPYDTTFTTGDVVRINQNSPRRSWALLQPPAKAKMFVLYKPFKLPTNILMYARLRYAIRRDDIVNGDGAVLLNFLTSNGGVPTKHSRVVVFLQEPDAGQSQAQSEYWASGAGAGSGIVESTNAASQGQALEYLAIHKRGTDYDTWVGTSEGNWIWMNHYSSMGFDPDMVGIGVMNNQNGSPGVLTQGVDFIRFIETDTFLL